MLAEEEDRSAEAGDEQREGETFYDDCVHALELQFSPKRQVEPIAQHAVRIELDLCIVLRSQRTHKKMHCIMEGHVKEKGISGGDRYRLPQNRTSNETRSGSRTAAAGAAACSAEHCVTRSSFACLAEADAGAAIKASDKGASHIRTYFG